MTEQFRDKAAKLCDRFLEHSLYGMFLLLPMSKAALEVFFGIAFVGFWSKKSFRPNFKFILEPSSISLLFFLFFCALAIPKSGPYIDTGMNAFVFKWLEYVTIYFFAVDGLNRLSRLRVMIYFLLSISVLVAIDGIFQRITGVDFLRGKTIINIRQGVDCVTGPFNHFNDFGAYLSVILSLLVAMILTVKMRTIIRWLLILLSLLLGANLLMTNSRGSWLGFLCALLLMLILTRKFKVFGLMFLIGGIAYSLPFVRDRIAYSFYQNGDGGRSIIWEGTIRMISESPWIGKGLGTYMQYFSSYVHDISIQYAHNCYLQIWAEAGIFTLLSLLVFLAIMLKEGIKAYNRTKDGLLLGILCGIFGFLVHSFFDTQLYSLQLSVLFWILLGMLYNSTKDTPPLQGRELFFIK